MSVADPGDRFHVEARKLAVDSTLELAALDLTLYEAANAVGVRMGRTRRAQRLVQLVVARCGDRLARVGPDLLADATEIAAEHRLSAYDTAYVAAARHNGWQLVSIDIRDLVSKGLAVTPDAALYP